MTETFDSYATGLNRPQIASQPLRFDLAMDAPADYEQADRQADRQTD